jgi:OFA family oxalate/formate antiporter-like MFS transporter
MFMAFNYKEYGFIKITDDAFLTVVGSCGAIFNGMGRLAWGALFDHLSFKTISLSINIIFITCGLLVPYIAYSEYLYLAMVCLIYFAYGGNYSVYPTQTIRIFGSEMGPKIYWITFSGFTIGNSFPI